MAFSVIYSLLFAKRLEFDDPLAKFVTTTISQLIASLSPVYDLFPLVTKIPKVRRHLEKMGDKSKELMSLLEDKICECLNQVDSDDNFVKEFCKKAGT